MNGVQLNPGSAFFKGLHKSLPLSKVAFKEELSLKEITNAHPCEKLFYAFNRGYAFNPGALKRGLTVFIRQLSAYIFLQFNETWIILALCL